MEGKMNIHEAILVWPFDKAPELYKAYSEHGGDEDWLALVPPALKDEYIPWLDGSGPFGVCDISKHPLSTGHTIYIGVHA